MYASRALRDICTSQNSIAIYTYVRTYNTSTEHNKLYWRTYVRRGTQLFCMQQQMRDNEVAYRTQWFGKGISTYQTY